MLEKKTPDMQSEEALFGSATGALLFALNFSHGGLKKPSLVELMGGGRPGKGLAGLDGAGQAGMIQLELQALSDLHRAILIARYAPRSEPCSCRRPCCRGWVQHPYWEMAIDYLTQHVLEKGLTGTISHYRLRRALVERYFGVRISFIDIAAECKVHRDTASDYYARVVDYFRGKPPEKRGAEWHAKVAFEERLKRGGLIE